jgi:hypothetical protein
MSYKKKSITFLRCKKIVDSNRMEEDIQKHLHSPLPHTREVKKIEDKLKEAIKVAQERQDYDSAHNDQLLRALKVVEAFIKRKKRVCYGGTAMNAILPEKLKFYNAEHDLPDYDFYTPDPAKDVDELVADLKAAGFDDVYHKVGIHEGTKKILVNFTPVADISSIEPELFATLFRRSILKNGVHYTDPDVLRMMMYLELSRPKGQVGRWEKVFERLQLINKAFPAKGCRAGAAAAQPPSISPEIRATLLNYVIENQRILCNGGLEKLYRVGIQRGKVKFALNAQSYGPAVLFMSPDPRADALRLKEILRVPDVRLFLHKARGEIVPQRIELRHGNVPICLLIQEVACHSTNRVPLEDGRFVHIASLELLVTLYLALHIFTAHSAEFLGEGVSCQVAGFIQMAGRNYRATRSAFPAFSLSCVGHQTGYASLLRAKVARIKKEKGGVESVLKKAKGVAKKGTRKAAAAPAKKAGTKKAKPKK